MTTKMKVWILALSAVLALAYNYLRGDDWQRWGLNYFLIILMLVIATAIFLRVDQKKTNPWLWYIIVPTLWFGFSVFLYESRMIQAFGMLGSCAGLFYWWFWSGVERIDGWKVQKLFPVALVNYFGSFFSNIYKPFTGVLQGKTKLVARIILGMVIAIPFLVIFYSLFSSADRIFSRLFHNLFNWNIDAELVWRVIRTTILFVLANGVFYALLREPRLSAKDDVYAVRPEKKTDDVILSIVLGALNLLFLVFIVMQVSFLFGGEQVIKSYGLYGMTYADYARNGFYQMMVAAMLVLGLSYVVSRLNNVKKLNWPRVLNLGLIIETLVITAWALKRLWLYQHAYAYTVSRCLAGEVIVFVAIILVLLFMVLLLKKPLSTFVKFGFLFSIVFGIILTSANLESMVARKNIEGFANKQYERFDTYYLMNLSVDAGPEILKLRTALPDPNKEYEAFIYDWKKAHDYRYMTPSYGSHLTWRTLTISHLWYWYEDGAY